MGRPNAKLPDVETDSDEDTAAASAWHWSLAFAHSWLHGFHYQDADNFNLNHAKAVSQHLSDGNLRELHDNTALSARTRRSLAKDKAYAGEVAEDFVYAEVDISELTKAEALDLQKTYFPWFVVYQVSVCFLLWAFFATKTCLDASDTGACPELCASNDGCPCDTCTSSERYFCKAQLQCAGGWLNTMAGVSNIFPSSVLEFHSFSCESYREQVWRLLTYQFTHANMAHVGINSFLTIMVGTRLSIRNGFLRMFLMFNFGVLGGALAVACFDVHSMVVGMSGGCYALMGMVVADLQQNWKLKPFRKVEVAFLVTLLLVDVLFSLVFTHSNSHKSSLACHAGGLFAGYLSGMLFERDFHKTPGEKVCRVVVFVVFAGLLAAAWLRYVAMGPSAPMNNLFDEDPAWCYLRLVSDFNTFGDNGWHCVYCGTGGCMQRWNTHLYVKTVTQTACHAYAGDPWNWTPHREVVS